jgi:ankyrin repeat protein
MKRLPRREFLVGTAASGFALTASAVMPTFAGLASADSTSSLVSEPPNSIAAELLKKETDPFRKAVLTGDLDAVKRFVARDPSLVYSRDAQGQSVYLLAAYAGQAEVITFLEAKGITLDICEAVAGDRLDRVNELLGSAEGLLNMPNVAGDTPLHVAAICNRSGVVGNTIMYGPEFSVRNPQRKNATPAHLALAEAPPFIAEDMAFAMVGNGLDPNLATTDGDTILHCAARAGDPRVVRLLIQKGADAGARNSAEQTAQDIAQAGGKAEAVAVLRGAAFIPRDYYARRYAYNAKFEALKRDDTGGLPREFINRSVVVSHFSLERVKNWIDLCPSLVNTRASWDELPVEAAAHMGRADIGGLLLDRGASYSICTAAVFGSLVDVKRMLAEDGQRIHERGAHSFPLLWYTAFGTPKIETAEYLIGAGADPKEDMRGRTVLHVAATGGYLELCRLFLEKGLDPLQTGMSFLGTQDAVDAAEQAKHPEVATMLRDWIKLHPATAQTPPAS